MSEETSVAIIKEMAKRDRGNQQEQIDALEWLLTQILNSEPNWDCTAAWEIARARGAFVGMQWDKVTS